MLQVKKQLFYFVFYTNALITGVIFFCQQLLQCVVYTVSLFEFKPLIITLYLAVRKYKALQSIFNKMTSWQL